MTRQLNTAARALALSAAMFAAFFGIANGEISPARDLVTVDSQTDTVIKGSLRYLASKQSGNGSWLADGAQTFPVAITGYTIMTFLATGNLPDEGPYSRNVAAGMKFLLDSVQPDGTFRGVAGDRYMYSHAIATIALAELYGQIKGEVIRPKLVRLVSVIIKSQNPQGGWRYQPRPNDADISVTVLQVVALRAAKNAGIDVPQQTIDNAVKYVRGCYVADKGGFQYQAGGGEPGFARTAAAIYSLQVCGHYDDPLVKAGSGYLFNHPEDTDYQSYGLFYAAPAQYMIGGDTWNRWYSKMKQMLLKKVIQSGGSAHWDNTLGGGNVGEVYCTSIYTTILAMPWHYIPLYQR